MSENTTPKPNFAKKAATAVRKHERKILVGITVASTTVAVISRAGIAQHNAFLKEKGLFEEFYDLVPTEA